MTVIPAELLDQLDALHAAATPGPWTAATAPAEGSDESPAQYLAGALDPDSGRPLWVAWAGCHRPEHDGLDYVVTVVTGDGPGSEANARYLAHAHDAMPRLTAAVRAALSEHKPLDEDDASGQYCELDGRVWPCQSVRAITSALAVRPTTDEEQRA